MTRKTIKQDEQDPLDQSTNVAIRRGDRLLVKTMALLEERDMRDVLRSSVRDYAEKHCKRALVIFKEQYGAAAEPR